MPFTLTMPKLSPTMEEGTIAKWHKKEGDFVDVDELIMEVSTDKATVEHNVLDPGYLRKILIKEGESAATNQPIAIFTEKIEESIEGYTPEGEVPEPVIEEEKIEMKEEVAIQKPVAAMARPTFAPQPPLEGYRFEYLRKAVGKRTFASPLAKRLAEEKGLELTSVKGSGPGGRIMSRDLKIAQPHTVFGSAPRKAPDLLPGTYEEERLTPMRKMIAERLQEAKSFIPHIYVRIEVDVDPLVVIREQLVEGGTKLTYNDFVVKACASVLRQHPAVNSGYNSANDTLIRFQTIDISLAVTVEGGLITPIIRHTDYKTLPEISAETKELARRAKVGKLEMHEYQGGSFTISNMGMFGVTDFQAIINPPQAAILAVGGIKEQPVVREGKVVPGRVMNLVLSADHRVIDGVEAAKFLRDLKKVLENPALLL